MSGYCTAVVPFAGLPGPQSIRSVGYPAKSGGPGPPHHWLLEIIAILVFGVEVFEVTPAIFNLELPGFC